MPYFSLLFGICNKLRETDLLFHSKIFQLFKNYFFPIVLFYGRLNFRYSSWVILNLFLIYGSCSCVLKAFTVIIFLGFIVAFSLLNHLWESIYDPTRFRFYDICNAINQCYQKLIGSLPFIDSSEPF